MPNLVTVLYARDMGLYRHVAVQVAILDDASSCFNKISMHDKYVVTWNAMIVAYTSHGQGTEAVSNFRDAITFTFLLSWCSHAGLTESMRAVCGVEPRL